MSTTLPKTANIILDLKGEDYAGGSTWKDTTRDITFNMVNITRDTVNNGPKFNGGNSYAERISGVPSFSGMPFTIICYYYKNASNNNDTYVNISRTGDDYNNEVIFNQYTYMDYSSGYGVEFYPTTNSTQSGLRMASAVRSNQLVKLYLNDQKNGEKAGIFVRTDNDNVFIGSDRRDGKDYLNGTIKRFIIYNTTLTDEEITSVYNIVSNIVVEPLTLDALTENISVYKHLYNPNELKQLSVNVNGGSGSYTYAWSGSGIVSSSNGSAYIKYRDGISGETITLTVRSASFSVTKTFNITYINPTPIVVPSTSIPNNTLQITTDNRVAANVVTGIGKFIGAVTTVNAYTPPPGQGIVTLAAKLIESTISSGVTSLNFDVDKYKSDGSKYNSILGNASTYGTILFDISANRSFGINWVNSLGTTYNNIASYNLLNNEIKTTYNTTLTYTTSNGRNYFTYTGPNSQTIILINQIGASGVPCFVSGTRIMTPTGERLVEDLRSGDMIVSADGRIIPATVYSTNIAKTTQENAPYLIPANAFSANFPPQDIILSPKHAIQSRKGVWEIPQFAESRYRAIKKTNIGEAVEYFHIELPNFFTDNLIANGSVCESLGSKAQAQLNGKALYTFNKKLGGFTKYNPISEKLTK
jgi:hypothetical protein